MSDGGIDWVCWEVTCGLLESLNPAASLKPAPLNSQPRFQLSPMASQRRHVFVSGFDFSALVFETAFSFGVSGFHLCGNSEIVTAIMAVNYSAFTKSIKSI